MRNRCWRHLSEVSQWVTHIHASCDKILISLPCKVYISLLCIDHRRRVVLLRTQGEQFVNDTHHVPARYLTSSDTRSIFTQECIQMIAHYVIMFCSRFLSFFLFFLLYYSSLSMLLWCSVGDDVFEFLLSLCFRSVYELGLERFFPSFPSFCEYDWDKRSR